MVSIKKRKGYGLIGTRVDKVKLFVIKIYSVIYRLCSLYNFDKKKENLFYSNA